MSDAIAQAVAAAEAAAKAAQNAAGGTAVAVAPAQGGAVGMPVKPGPKLTMDTVMTGQLNVDAWLKPKEFGLMIGDKPDLLEGAVVSIDMSDGKGFIVKKGIKAGNPAQYWYTTDGVTCTTGGSWEAAMQKAKSINGAAYEYRCVDIPMTVLEEIKGNKSGLILEVGKTLGYTTSTTNWKAWEEFYQDVAEKGLLGQVVKVEIGYERKENKAGNKWGIVTFKLVGSLADEEGGE